MKKRDIANLIKFHYDKDELQFRTTSSAIARDFEASGDHELASYVMSFLTNANTFVPQSVHFESRYLKPVKETASPLPLPSAIAGDIQGIINAVNHHVGINKFLFEGAPGTGKTESAKQVARLLNRQLFKVDFNELIDSKMGQTAKNIAAVFSEINRMPAVNHTVILFDELDAIALDRVNSNDIREMGRATSSMLSALDDLNSEVVLIATTNLFKAFDRAFTRRFDSVISFDRYSQADLADIATAILSSDLRQFKTVGRDMKLFSKIIKQVSPLPMPGELENLIKVSLAFSDPSQPYDYLRRLYLTTQRMINMPKLTVLKEQGFTFREITVLTGISKSQVARDVRGDVE